MGCYVVPFGTANAHPVQTLYNYVLGESVFGRTVLELAIYYALAFM